MTGTLALRTATAFPSRRQIGAALAVVALLLLSVQGWAPALLGRGGSAVLPATADVTDIDVAAVVEQARHTLAPVPGQPGALEVTDSAYRASFDETGFSYTPAGGSALSVSLSGIARGGDRLALDTGAWTGRSNVAERPVATGVVERVTARDGEIEWDVVLGWQPEGTGDLVVRADLAGHRGRPAQVRGPAGPALHLGLGGGERVRMGEVVVVDATGAELHRALPIVRDGLVELVVPEWALDQATYPLTVDPVVGGRQSVISCCVWYTPSVASGGGTSLIVFGGGTTTAGIYGALVSPDGTVDIVGAISQGPPPDSVRPDVAWNGDSFLVTWEYHYGPGDPDILGQRVSPSGDLLGGPIPISTPVSVQRAPAVTALGPTFFVVWEDCRGTSCDIYGGRVSSTGAVLDGSGVPLATDSKNELAPDVAASSSQYLITYEYEFSSTDIDVYARRVAAIPAPGSAIPVSNAVNREGDPAVASDGTGWYVAWEEGTTTDPNNIWGARINSAGVVLDPQGVPIADRANQESEPAIAYNGVFLVAWRWQFNTSGDDDILASRVGTDGTVQDPDGFGVDAAGSPEDTPAVSPAPGDDWAVVYESGPINQSGIFQRLVSPK